MWQMKITPALCLFISTLACKRPEPIRLQPTIEEPAALASRIRISDPSTSAQLLRGFYPLDQPGWRWTAPRFTVALAAPPRAHIDGARLVLDFNVVELSIATLKKLVLTARLGDVALDPETITTAGSHEYRRDVPASAFTKDVMPADFAVDRFLKPEGDGRELGLIVTAVGLESR